jgi:hypothetical protein
VSFVFLFESAHFSIAQLQAIHLALGVLCELAISACVCMEGKYRGREEELYLVMQTTNRKQNVGNNDGLSLIQSQYHILLYMTCSAQGRKPAHRQELGLRP